MQTQEQKEVALQIVFWGFMLIMFVVSIAATGYTAYHVGKLILWKQDNHVCNTLQLQATQYPDFYITEGEAERCADYQIDAPVKSRTEVTQ